MLFVQGTRDQLADAGLIQKVAEKLGPSASVEMLDGADHSFHVLARSRRTDLQMQADILDSMTAWMERRGES